MAQQFQYCNHVQVLAVCKGWWAGLEALKQLWQQSLGLGDTSAEEGEACRVSVTWRKTYMLLLCQCKIIESIAREYSCIGWCIKKATRDNQRWYIYTHTGSVCMLPCGTSTCCVSHYCRSGYVLRSLLSSDNAEFTIRESIQSFLIVKYTLVNSWTWTPFLGQPLLPVGSTHGKYTLMSIYVAESINQKQLIAGHFNHIGLHLCTKYNTSLAQHDWHCTVPTQQINEGDYTAQQLYS